jgi:hypothetical protein
MSRSGQPGIQEHPEIGIGFPSAMALQIPLFLDIIGKGSRMKKSLCLTGQAATRWNGRLPGAR